jgi:CBS domain
MALLDGVGFEPSFGSVAGFGLRGMRERVERLGGTLRIPAYRTTGGSNAGAAVMLICASTESADGVAAAAGTGTARPTTVAAMQLMVEHGVHQVPIAQDTDRLIGMLSRADLMRYMHLGAELRSPNGHDRIRVWTPAGGPPGARRS